jgi:hypothetical protein
MPFPTLSPSSPEPHSGNFSEVSLLSVGLFADYLHALSEQEQQTARHLLRQIKSSMMESNANALEMWDTHAGILRPLLKQWAQVEVAIGAFEF